MFALGLRKQRAGDPDKARRALKVRVRHVLHLSDDTAVSISHAHCAAPACTEPQTTVLLFVPDRPTLSLHIDKPPEHIGDADILHAMLQAGSQPVG